MSGRAKDAKVYLTQEHLGQITDGMRAARRLVLASITELNAVAGEHPGILPGEALDPLHEALAAQAGVIAILTLIAEEQWPVTDWEPLP